jgi:hypothetical protein
MAEPMNGPITRCPWCSAPLPEGDHDACPSCHATLTAAPGAEGDIKGVTTLDPEAILRARSEVARPRSSNRLLSFITGEVPVDTSAPADPEVFAPPPDEVRREMLRLQLEAQQADRAAETVALKADELARLGIPLSELGGEPPEPAADEPVADEPAADAPAAVDAPNVEAPAAGDPAASEPEGGWPDELTPTEPAPRPGG